MSCFQDGVTVDTTNRDIPICTTPRRTMLTVVYEYYTSAGSGFTFGYTHHGCCTILFHVGLAAGKVALQKICFSHPLSSSGTHIHITAPETWGRPVQSVRYNCFGPQFDSTTAPGQTQVWVLGTCGYFFWGATSKIKPPHC
jgi:hypothetical protein